MTCGFAELNYTIFYLLLDNLRYGTYSFDRMYILTSRNVYINVETLYKRAEWPEIK